MGKARPWGAGAFDLPPALPDSHQHPGRGGTVRGDPRLVLALTCLNEVSVEASVPGRPQYVVWGRKKGHTQAGF